MSKPYLVALGTACFDEYYSADSWVSEGDKLLVHPMEKKAGGMVANAAASWQATETPSISSTS